MNSFITHCAICWNGFNADIITITVSGLLLVPRCSQNMKSGYTRSAGNQRQTRSVSSQVGSSETTRATHSTPSLKSGLSPKFCQWMAGLIDGDGCFLVSKAGYVSCEITMGSNDLHCVRVLQNALGGSIKMRSGVNALRWRLHNKQGMIVLVNYVNGYIRHSARLLQLHRVCQALDITPKTSDIMSTSNAWFAGFFDADGTVTLNSTTLTISVTNKYIADVQAFKDTFGGYIYFDSAQNGYYKWTVQSRTDILLMLSYFKLCVPRSSKSRRIWLINRYYALRDLRAHLTDSTHHSAWLRFVKKWDANI